MQAPSPVDLPSNWLATVNDVQGEADLEQARHSVCRGTPPGSESWVRQVVEALGLQATQRPRGRPRRDGNGNIVPLSAS